MRKPDLSGIGEAWIIENTQKRKDDTDHASVRNWLVKGPFHPFWNHWYVGVVHLRDLPNQSRPPSKKTPDMTHEFMIISLNPQIEGEVVKGKMRDFDPDDMPYPLPFLQPLDVVVQFKCASDAHAVDVCDAAINDIISGGSSPDSDFRGYWEKVIPATAACDKHSEKGMQ